ncbi:hypothetical protein BJV78DRAFT_1156244 [Lactifluus subvellereus]|nr:hypothetical protein BJV78DRAFT_1156244 [Lactifluus subvellereus]
MYSLGECRTVGLRDTDAATVVLGIHMGYRLWRPPHPPCYLTICSRLLTLLTQIVTSILELHPPDPNNYSYTWHLWNLMDPVRDLNNYLQGHPKGNLTPSFSWCMSRSGPDHQATHYATAKFEGAEIGHGRSFSIGNAKRLAAMEALQYLRATHG